VIAPDHPEVEDLRRTLTGLVRGDLHPLTLGLHPLTGLLRRDLHPLTLGPGTLTGILGSLREALGVGLAQRLRDLDPPTGYARHTLMSLHGGNHPPLTHALGALPGVLRGSHPPLTLGRGTLPGVLRGNLLPFMLGPGTAHQGRLKVAHEKLHFL